MYCLFGNVSNDVLLDSFYKFLSKGEEVLVLEALKTENENIYDDPDFQEILERFNCRSRVHPLNVYGIFVELARQEIVQRPFSMVSTWNRVLIKLKTDKNFQSTSALKAFFKQTTPTNSSIIRLLTCNPANDSERDTFKYLKQYIRGLTEDSLKRLLRFLTGADIIIVDGIKVSFICFQSEFERRPIAHTCAPLLELPSSYRNFCELREEFEGILRRDNWEMDTY